MNGFFEAVQDALMKVLTFVTSRRNLLLAFVAAVLGVFVFFGVGAEQSAEIVKALGETTDAGAAVVAAVMFFLEKLAVLIGLLVLAYKTISSHIERPATMRDYLPALPKDYEG